MGGGNPCDSPALAWTPACVVVDVAQGNPTYYDPPAAEPPADNRPTCDSYKKSGLSDADLRGFNTAPNCKGPNTLTTWLAQERTKFCEDINNFTKNPGGTLGSCVERNAGLALAKEYCGQTDKIKTAAACTRAYLGDDTWVELANAYCQSTDGQADPWCSCYNVMNNVCDTNPNASGCAEKALNYDVLVEKTPVAFRTAWSGRAPCYGLVCQESATGSKHIPANANQNCAAPIQICGQSIQAEGITESTIDAKCNIGGREYDQDGNLVNPGNPAANFAANLPTSVQKYLPLSFDDLKGGDTNKKIGAGASVASSFMSCACVVLLLLLVTSGGDSGRPSRFRR
jgi:hypothetical protein